VHDARTEGDVDTIGEIFSAQPYLAILGSDPEEWVTGKAAVNVFNTQTKEMGERAIEFGNATGYRCGNVGWAVLDTLETWPNGLEITGRTTAVFAIERGHWRIVQWQFAVLQPNEVTGIALTTSVEQIGHLVQDE